MSKEVSKNLRCIRIFGGVEIWLEEERAQGLANILDTLTQAGKKKLLEIEGELVMSDQVVGIFTPRRMEEVTRRKHGQWQCMYNTWHERGQGCECMIAARMQSEPCMHGVFECSICPRTV